MPIRSYQAGDEHAQARIYNTAAAGLPGFKPATPAEITRRFQAVGSDPRATFYAEDDGEVVGYAVFAANGQISWPWVLHGAEALRQPLLETMLAEMRRRGLAEAWAAYRADWTPVLDDLRERGFTEKRTMINYVADLASLPVQDRVGSSRAVEPLARDELHLLLLLQPELFAGTALKEIERFFGNTPTIVFRDDCSHFEIPRAVSFAAFRCSSSI